jgi:hypothetical protein
LTIDPMNRARRLVLVLTAAGLVTPATRARAELPFGAGERLEYRITWARLLAGRARLSVERGWREGTPVLQFVLEAHSEGFFAWLTRFRVDDRTAAVWDPERRCSLGIEKRLREGRHARDQRVRFDPDTGRATIDDARLRDRVVRAEPCTQDVLSAFFAARARGFTADGGVEPVRTLDNGRRFDLRFRPAGYDTVDLRPPLGPRVRARVFEVLLVPETGLFEKQGRLLLWVTDDALRLPVRLRAKAPIGWVSAELETYRPAPAMRPDAPVPAGEP